MLRSSVEHDLREAEWIDIADRIPPDIGVNIAPRREESYPRSVSPDALFV
jgi:hypothetical protein